MSYLWLKALHIIFMVTWFAGLFYLPRIFVNLASVQSDETYQHLLVMAKKLYRFITPLMLLTFVFGVLLIIKNSSLLSMKWFIIKLILVSSLIIYHFLCGHYLKVFSQRSSTKNHIFFRWFNEYPVIILFAVVLLVVLKPI